MVKKGSEILGRIAEADGIPLEKAKEESIIFGKKGRKVETVKWLGIILDSKLKFQEHLKMRVKRATQMLGTLRGLGNSSWGLKPMSWGQAYTGMIRTIALWGAEVGWRGQEKWRKALRKIQYQSLRKCAGAPQGTPIEDVDKIMGVESIETKIDMIQACFVARSMCDGIAMEGLWPPDFEKSEEKLGKGRDWTDHEDSKWKAGTDGFGTVAVRMVQKLGMEGDKEISWGGACQKVEVFSTEIGDRNTNRNRWEVKIKETIMGEDYNLAFMNGSKQEDGRTGAGWTVRNNFHEGRGLRKITTVWDAEVTPIAEALGRGKEERLLILSDSKAAIAVIIKAGKMGQERTKALREATNLIAKRCRKDNRAVCLNWVKSHIEIDKNEAAGKLANGVAERQEAEEGTKCRTLVTEGGIKQKVSVQWREERSQKGRGLGKIPGWERRAATWYTYIRTNREPVGKLKKHLGKTEDDNCGKSGV